MNVTCPFIQGKIRILYVCSPMKPETSHLVDGEAIYRMDGEN
jgi:hypothetical protein